MGDLATLDIRIVVLILVVSMLTAWNIGTRLGERLLHEGGTKPSKFDDASMALLSLLLAFSFGMSIARHDQRRLAVVADSNAIEISTTCASILKEPSRTKLQGVIRQYAQVRLDLARGALQFRPRKRACEIRPTACADDGNRRAGGQRWNSDSCLSDQYTKRGD